MKTLKILVIRLSSIGDIVLTSPIPRCLSLQLGAEVHFLVKKQFAPLVIHNPYVNKVIEFDGCMKNTLKLLKTEHYDLVIDLHRNFRSCLVKINLPVKSHSVKKLDFKKWLFVTLKINRLPNCHFVDRCFDTIAPLGVKNDGMGLNVFFDPREGMPEMIDLPLDYAVLAVGAKHITKILPSDKMEKICLNLAAEGRKLYGENFRVVLLGGKEDVMTGKLLSEKCGDAVMDTTGLLTLSQSASVINRSHVVYSGDTGLMHIAAALDRNIVSLWGPTVPEFGMYPYLPSDSDKKSIIVEDKTISCRPCSKIGRDKCPKTHFKCMNFAQVPIYLPHTASVTDTHTHIFLSEFDDDRARVIRDCFDKGVRKMIMPNVDASSIPLINKVLAEYDNRVIYGAMGLHPTSVGENYEEELLAVKEELFSGGYPYLAIGEIGMDLYWDSTYLRQQEVALRTQFDWALELNLPVIIHSRKAEKEVVEIIEEERYHNLRGVFHCWSGDRDLTSRIIAHGGFFFGVGGSVTYKNSALPEVVSDISLDRILLETDSPYLSPVPYRGKRNNSTNIIIVAKRVAEIKNRDFSEVVLATEKNVKKLFNI